MDKHYNDRINLLGRTRDIFERTLGIRRIPEFPNVIHLQHVVDILANIAADFILLVIKTAGGESKNRYSQKSYLD